MRADYMYIVGWGGWLRQGNRFVSFVRARGLVARWNSTSNRELARFDIDELARWNRSDIEVKPKWNRCETKRQAKWNRSKWIWSELEVSTKWSRIEIDLNLPTPHPTPKLLSNFNWPYLCAGEPCKTTFTTQQRCATSLSHALRHCWRTIRTTIHIKLQQCRSSCSCWPFVLDPCPCHCLCHCPCLRPCNMGAQDLHVASYNVVRMACTSNMWQLANLHLSRHTPSRAILVAGQRRKESKQFPVRLCGSTLHCWCFSKKWHLQEYIES